jgi:hypothetical protein
MLGQISPSLRNFFQLLTRSNTWTAAQNFSALATFNAKIISSLSNSSSSVGSSDSLTIANPTGSFSHISATFNSSPRAALTFDSNGNIFQRSLGAIVFQLSASNINAMTEYGRINTVGFSTTQNGFFGAGVYAGTTISAGWQNVGAAGTLSSYGSLGLKGNLVKTNITLNQSHNFVYCDTSESSFCSGNPTHTCDFYLNSGTCNSHLDLGCSWSVLGYCSDRNGTDSSSCTSYNAICSWENASCASFSDQSSCQNQSGCTWSENSCAGFPDSSTCNAQSGCSWVTSDCADFNGQSEGTCEGNDGCTWSGGDCTVFGDESSCTSGHTGCMWVGTDCGGFSDESSCTANDGCSWDGDNSICSGTYGLHCEGLFDEGSTCSGSYNPRCDGTFYNCQGTYDTGNCVGGEFGVCSGTAACSNIGSQVTCESEGCTWSQGFTVTLPDLASTSASQQAYENQIRLYGIKKINSGAGSVAINAAADDRFFDGATSKTLSSQGDFYLLHGHIENANCTGANKVTCNSRSGCTWNFTDCSTSFFDSSSCNAQAGCSWDGILCNGEFNTSCTGTYVKSKKWYSWSHA